MRFSQQVRYAVEGLFHIAYHGGGEPVQVRVIGEHQAIPARYLEQIFQRMRKAGLLRGKRGPGGGYVLAKPVREITLRKIVESLEGPAETWFEEPTDQGESRFRPDCLWPTLSSRVGALFDEWTLEELCQRASRDGVPKIDAGNRMYFI